MKGNRRPEPPVEHETNIFNDDKDVARAIRTAGKEISEGLRAVASALAALAPQNADRLDLTLTKNKE